MYTVLLVDDEQSIRHLCADVLAGMQQLHILQAGSGREAIDTASKYDGAIELVLSDITMPGGITGVDLAECLAVSRPEIKVLLMSGNGAAALLMEPGWRFLPKPFRPSDLLGHLQAILPAVSVLNAAP